MSSNWWWAWLGFVFVVLVLPLSYGWGYRRWGPPYPTYYNRRRLRRPVPGGIAPRSAGSDESVTAPPNWGWKGDLVWLAFVVAVVWFLVQI